ncbi:ATP-dependent DNA helicase chl1 [Clarireedia jacksonii]
MEIGFDEEEEEEEEDEPDWIRDAARERMKKEMLRKREDLEGRLRRVREKERREMDKMNGIGRGSKRRKMGGDDGQNGVEKDEENFVLDDWDSDAEAGGNAKTGDEAVFSKETLELMEAVGMRARKIEEEEDDVDEMKIFYCSRTHSQLTQFINELRRVNFPPSIPPSDLAQSPSTDLSEPIKHLTLGSRKNLCINPKVNTLSSVTVINERCAELQQSSTPGEQKCPHLPTKDNKPLVHTFRDHALATIRDIEDMGSLGKELSICPYYASRAAIKPAEIVTLPYPLLLQKSAREALGISLKGHVVIIDEAHNLMDAISGIYGSEISLRELRLGREMLGAYLKKFAKRLMGKNRVYVAQVVRVVDSLVGYLEGKLEGKEMDGVVDEKELLAGKGVDQINLFKLIRYLQESKLARKIESYATHTANEPPSTSTNKPTPRKPPSTTPVLHTITSLLHSLTHPTTEGRLFFSKPVPPTPSSALISLKFLLLDPSPHLSSLLSLPRALLLAGGTMSPFSTYTTHLFPSVPPSRITTLSCGHVVPKENLFVGIVSRGPTGRELRFDFKNRGDAAILEELGRVLLNVCTVVGGGGGVVVFFPSYKFLADVITHLSLPPSNSNSNSNPSTPHPNSLLHRLQQKKPLFTETKSDTSDSILAAYSASIAAGKGGLLFSVVGGKLSEGINFSDDLGRCVVLVGLPYPNAATAEWRARGEWVVEGTVARLRGKGEREEEARRIGQAEARDFYENTCLRAVNQSVGRAIRHRADWAGILLVDTRFRGERVRGKLAGWVGRRIPGMQEGARDGNGLLEEEAFGRLVGRLGAFVRGRRGGGRDNV